jgi:hypothetical protein
VAWLTDDEVKDALADTIKMTGGGAALPAHWTRIAQAANEEAIAYITAFVQSRGYTAASAVTWNLARSFNRRYALWRAGVDGREQYSEGTDDALNQLDPRKDMAALANLFAADGTELPVPAVAAVTSAGAGVPDWRKGLDAAVAPAYRAARIYPPAVVPPTGWGYGGP